MAVTYRLTESEFVDAQRLLMSAAFRRRQLIVLAASAMVLIGLALLRPFMAAPIAIALPAIALISWWWLLPRAWRRLYRRVPDAQREILLDYSPDGLTVETPVSRGAVQWSAYSHFLETDALLLLVQPSQVAVPIPKRAFAPDDLARFRALVQERLPRGRPGRSARADGSTAARP